MIYAVSWCGLQPDWDSVLKEQATRIHGEMNLSYALRAVSNVGHTPCLGDMPAVIRMGSNIWW